MDDTIVKVDTISKKYCRTLKHTMLYGTIDLAKIFAGFDQHTENLRSGEFWALEGVSFDVHRGETLGLIGLNGSGKSTLLKMLNGIFMPDKGKIEIKGKVGALIEVGAGFHPMLTGRENVYVNGAILGMSKREIDKRFDAIVDFADIESFIDSPVKHYSSGMYVRLGFAVAIHCEPDILLIDEVLAVGDIQFTQKCFRKIEQYRQDGGTIVLVTHNLEAIKKSCHEVLLLDRGRIVGRGEPTEIVDLYNAIVFKSIYAHSNSERSFSREKLDVQINKRGCQRFGTRQAEICAVNIANSDGNYGGVIYSLESTLINVDVCFHEEIENIVVGITIRNINGIDVYMTNTNWKGIDIPVVQKNMNLEVVFEQRMCLAPGQYTLTVAVSKVTSCGISRLDWISDCLAFEIISAEQMSGICNLDSTIRVKNYRPENRASS